MKTIILPPKNFICLSTKVKLVDLSGRMNNVDNERHLPDQILISCFFIVIVLTLIFLVYVSKTRSYLCVLYLIFFFSIIVMALSCLNSKCCSTKYISPPSPVLLPLKLCHVSLECELHACTIENYMI